jgi:hypothetical protein
MKRVHFQLLGGKKERGSVKGSVNHTGKAAITELNRRSLIACKLFPNYMINRKEFLLN